MGIASLVLGAIALATSWIPFICFIALILAIIGLILGIVDAVKKSKENDNKKWFGIAGLIISAIAIPIIIFASVVTVGFIVAIANDTYYDDYDYYYDDYYDEYYDNYEDFDDWYENWYDNYYNQLNSYNAI